MQGLAAHIDVQDQFNVIHNPSASRDEVTVALRNLSLDNSLQRQANAEIDARTIQLHRLQQLWNSLNCSGVTTVNFPQQTTAHLDNVSGEPYEAIGATYFGYDHSPPAVTGSGFAPDEAVTLSINGEQVGTGTADGNGTLNTTITLPEQPNGNYPLLASGVDSAGNPVDGWSLIASGAVSFNRITSATCDPTSDTWTVTNAWDLAGGDPDAVYTFSLSTGASYTARSDPSGRFSTTFTTLIPGGTTPTSSITGPMVGSGYPQVHFGSPELSYGGSWGTCGLG